ncbi:MAG: UDP-3-O-(3-hydroxymyristoyl)glucosamine N-acyltransferase [Phycisphaerales bacterium]
MHTTGSIAKAVGGEIIGAADLVIRGVNSLDRAAAEDLAFIRSATYARDWAASRAGAALVTRGIEVPNHNPANRALIVVSDADVALNKVLEAFAPPPLLATPGVHPSAAVDPSARVGMGATIGPMCVIEAGATIGDGAILMAQVFVGVGASVGAKTTIHPQVSIGTRCTIGRACLIHSGVVIGADGFGFIPAPDGRGLQKVPHIGHVEIGDQVEIGANSCIDRGKFGATTIGSGTKIDNLVQIGHNCQVGRACLICGQTGLAGSAIIGDGVILAGQSGVADNITVGAHARLGARAGLLRDLPAGETWLGYPAHPARDCLRNWSATLTLAQRLRRLEEANKLPSVSDD